MSKIEPMSVEEIKDFVAVFDVIYGGEWSRRMGKMILAWAHERARVNRRDWVMSDIPWRRIEPRTWTELDWLNEVLDEIGWPEDAR